MRLNPPTVFIFLIALILAVAAIAGHQGLVQIPSIIAAQDFWLAISAFIVLAVGNLVRGL